MKLENRKVTATKAKSILEQAGHQITIEQAEVIVRFMYFIATLAIKQYLRQHGESGSLH